MTDGKRSISFTSKGRVPYSYIKRRDAPPVAHYNAKYDQTEERVATTHLESGSRNGVEIRMKKFKKKACEKGNNYCSWETRKSKKGLMTVDA